MTFNMERGYEKPTNHVLYRLQLKVPNVLFRLYYSSGKTVRYIDVFHFRVGSISSTNNNWAYFLQNLVDIMRYVCVNQCVQQCE